MEKKKLSVKEQITHMKELGIKFELFNEEETEYFLTHSNYFFKVKSFAKNYKKDESGKYIDLDFKYLKELALMDTILRDIILELSLVIEHKLKVKLINDLTENEDRDAYGIVREFMEEENKGGAKPRILIFRIYEKRKSVDAYTNGLMDKYYKGGFPAWAFVEILTFSEFISFLEFYFEESKNKKPFVKASLLYNVKKLRNVAAHNNCFLNSLSKNPSLNITKYLRSKLRNFNLGCSKKELEDFLQVYAIHDYVSLLLLFDQLIDGDMKNVLKNKSASSLQRFKKHFDYFQDNKELYKRLEFIATLSEKFLS